MDFQMLRFQKKFYSQKVTASPGHLRHSTTTPNVGLDQTSPDIYLQTSTTTPNLGLDQTCPGHLQTL
jgi:hypothetical protein